MCTVVVLRRPDHRWPVLIAANRDEMKGRPWRPPGRHWPDRADVVAGMDEQAGGTWLGINDLGVVAAVLNRQGSLGQDPNLRSRGELPLEALDHADAVDAVAALADLDARSWRSFNMVIADNRDAFWLKGLGPDGDGHVVADPIPAGLSMLTSLDLNDRASGRVERFLPRFRAARAPDPDTGDWAGWEALLAAREDAPDSTTREGSMCVVTSTGFETLSSALIALPAIGAAVPEGRDSNGLTPIWRFCAGRPGEAPFETVNF